MYIYIESQIGLVCAFAVQIGSRVEEKDFDMEVSVISRRNSDEQAAEKD